eukprot:scaffold4129_cov82-Cyclotella_meneghiniana.AAC.11
MSCVPPVCNGQADAFDNVIPSWWDVAQLSSVAITHYLSPNHAQCGWSWSIYHSVSINALATVLIMFACNV